MLPSTTNRTQRPEQTNTSNRSRYIPRGVGNNDGDESLSSETWQDFLRRIPRNIDATQRQSALQRMASGDWPPSSRETSRDDEARRRSIATASYSRSFNQHGRQRSHAASVSGIGDTRVNQSYTRPQNLEMNNRSPPRLPSFDRREERGTGEYVVPSWQPDAEVPDCPICRRAFSFFFRKHHCRKCGRVVCASCSPHRITIPRQFIVHPPNDFESDAQGSAVEVIDLTADDDAPGRPPRTHDQDHLDPALGGGQEVRLCNPCVPDPNPLPPPPYSLPSPRGATSFPPTYPLPGISNPSQAQYWSTVSSGYVKFGSVSCQRIANSDVAITLVDIQHERIVTSPA